MAITKINPKYFLGAFLKNAKVFSSKVDEIIDFLNGTKGEGSCKEYVAMLDQTDTNAPVATYVMKNTLGGTPVFSYISDGYYRMTLTGAFPLDKTVVFIGDTNGDSTIRIWADADSANYINLTSEQSGVEANDCFAATYIKIQVYN